MRIKRNKNVVCYCNGVYFCDGGCNIDYFFYWKIHRNAIYRKRKQAFKITHS